LITKSDAFDPPNHSRPNGSTSETPQFGLVAEDVEKVNPDLVVRDAEGKVYTVRYEAVSAMLLNEFLKERKPVQSKERQLRSSGKISRPLLHNSKRQSQRSLQRPKSRRRKSRK